MKEFWPVAVVALLSGISVLIRLDPAGSYPSMPEGPGLTVDEIFNVEQGVYLIETSRALGWLNLIPGTSQEAFRRDNGYYNPDHPPLGRWWLGLHHHLAWVIAPPLDPDGPVVTACARTGSATAFALTVLIVGCFATAWSGRATGILTSIALVLMPRVYGHAHLASLETMTNLTCTLAVLSIANWWCGSTAPTTRTAWLTGILFGLALLTKIQAVLIPIPVALWAVYRWRTAAIAPLVAWGLTAFVVFLAGWPYLWFDPWANILEYLGRTTNRAIIHVWYFGHKYDDKLVPWHYSFCIFALTIPIVMHVLAVFGLVQSLRNRSNNGSEAAKPSTSPKRILQVSPDDSRQRTLLILACAVFPLVIFALPGVAVYDGERLFLTSYPLWAVFVGQGAHCLWMFLLEKLRSKAAAAVIGTGLVIYTASPLVTWSPCHLCYYNEIVTILGGAEKAGLEIDYWGEGITRSLLNQLSSTASEGDVVAITPTLHQFQADEYRRQSPILRGHRLKTVPYDPDTSKAKFLLVYRRYADLPEDLRSTSDRSGQMIQATPYAYLVRLGE